MSITGRKSWTGAVRERAVAALPPEKLLPDSQPAYMSSWIYVFGVLSLASLVVLIASGSVLSLKGPGWWHFTGIGHFFNSLHLWSVELFFFFMVIHLWGKYWMAAWRGGRARVWMTGVVCFLVAIPCALTGYVSQQNFDAQWISTQAKDAINSAGIGAFFNVLNFGQMYSYHVFLLPLAVVAIVVAHILLVRKHGIVPPFVLSASGEQHGVLAPHADSGPMLSRGPEKPVGSENESAHPVPSADGSARHPDPSPHTPNST
jgi:ubiquinol-cytochrome c reductase cytochrome b subunit